MGGLVQTPDINAFNSALANSNSGTRARCVSICVVDIHTRFLVAWLMCLGCEDGGHRCRDECYVRFDDELCAGLASITSMHHRNTAVGLYCIISVTA